jgi:hypothetical protein
LKLVPTPGSFGPFGAIDPRKAAAVKSGGSLIWPPISNISLVSIFCLLRLNLLPQKNMETPTKKIADTPEATDTPITSEEVSEDEDAAEVVAVEVAEVVTVAEMLVIAGILVVVAVEDKNVVCVLVVSVVLLTEVLITLLDGSMDTTVLDRDPVAEAG